MTNRENKKCIVKKGGYLETACWALQEAVTIQRSKASKGLFSRKIVNTKTGENVGTLVTVSSGKYVGHSVAMNYCPFCGEKTHDK